MHSQPHPDDLGQGQPVVCAVVTVSDSRTPVTDGSGQLIQQLLTTAGHRVDTYHLVKDEPTLIQALITELQGQVDVIICNGGTGIAPRDTTYDAIATLLEKQLPGFGELFRHLSYAEIGSRAMASRATAGTIGCTLIFSLPGSTQAVQLAMTALILPELRHLVKLLQSPSP